MKRLDFVSNSSSCSFFVYLPNENALNEFKNIFDLVYDKANVYKCDNYVYPTDTDCIDDKNDLKVENLYLIYCGEDYSEEVIYREEDLADRFLNLKNIIVYSDPYAHYTHGEKLSKSMKELKTHD
jgi:hypothetical protein